MRRVIGYAIVHCVSNGERSYERVVGVCFLPDETDIGAEIIRRGQALDCARWFFGRYRSLEPVGPRRHQRATLLPSMNLHPPQPFRPRPHTGMPWISTRTAPKGTQKPWNSGKKAGKEPLMKSAYGIPQSVIDEVTARDVCAPSATPR